jgi:hypothetical protein
LGERIQVDYRNFYQKLLDREYNVEIKRTLFPDNTFFNKAMKKQSQQEIIIREKLEAIKKINDEKEYVDYALETLNFQPSEMDLKLLFAKISKEEKSKLLIGHFEQTKDKLIVSAKDLMK